MEVMGNKLIFQRSFFLNFIFPEFNNSSSVLVLVRCGEAGVKAGLTSCLGVTGAGVRQSSVATGHCRHGRASRGAADNTHTWPTANITRWQLKVVDE